MAYSWDRFMELLRQEDHWIPPGIIAVWAEDLGPPPEGWSFYNIRGGAPGVPVILPRGLVLIIKD